MVTVEQLYKAFGVLADAKDKAGEHSEEYQTILNAVKSGTNEKRLAAQFIPRFFKHFTSLTDQAIDAQLDLCEDDDVSIRRQAIKELPNLCKGCLQNIPRIADILTQLLQSEDATELSIVNLALLSLFQLDAKGSLGGLFAQILTGEEQAREKAIRFITTKMKSLPEEVFTKDIEDFILLKTNEVLADVTAEEFLVFINILAGLKIMQTLTGRQQLVDIIVEQADLPAQFDPSDADSLEKIIQCVRTAAPFFSRNVHSTKFMSFLCSQVLPSLDKISSQPEAAAEDADDVRLEVLKLCAEIVPFSGDLEDGTAIHKLYQKLLEYMPLPPAETEAENGGGEKEKGENGQEPKLQFSYVECLMYIFHQMGKKNLDFLLSEENAALLKDFRIRLQYFARGCQVYMKQLRLALQGKSKEQLASEDNKVKVAALKVTSNINTLIKDLFHNPPSYKSSIVLSWVKPRAASSKRPGGVTHVTVEGAPATKKAQREMYQPPSGKFSSNISPGSSGGNRRGSWRGRGGFRGGRGRGWGRGNRY